MALRQYYRSPCAFARSRAPSGSRPICDYGTAFSAQLRLKYPCGTVENVTNYGTLPSRFLNAVDQLPNPRAQMFRHSDRWESISSEEFLRRVAGLSTALVELGVKTGDRVGIFSANRPEWHTADFAITGAGGVSVPI